MKAWMLLAVDERDRQYGGNDGYKDRVTESYDWNSRVPNAYNVNSRDNVVIWDKVSLLGRAIIEEVTTGSGWVTGRRCPSCHTSNIKARKTILPLYRCFRCHTEFDSALETEYEVTTFRAHFGGSWRALPGVMRAAELRKFALSPKSQHAMRELDWDSFVTACRAR